ncbi:hypothetical protein C8255_12475 [filamentous cyanobacterium CCP3]|nr:hypothetical protein C8255_12475 [filamentous cyanobacterium CCP3]
MLTKLKKKIETRKNFYSMRKIYRKYSSFTMLTEWAYINNLLLAEKIKSIEGCVIECGVWRGGMIAGLAELLGEERRYCLFDSFQGLPKAKKIDGEAAINWQKNVKGVNYHDNCSASEDYARKAMSISPAKLFTLHKGWFNETLSSVDFPEGIALLRLDADWYESTKICLEALFPYVSKNGLIILDDYYTWDGCSRALHDFLSQESRPERINSFNNICFLSKRGDE